MKRVWQMLEIDPTDDIKEIKRAYAKRLKIHHPEEDPEGYQRLREAYDQAIKMAKRRSPSPRDSHHESSPIVVIAEEMIHEPPPIAEESEQVYILYENKSVHENEFENESENESENEFENESEDGRHHDDDTTTPPIDPIISFMSRVEALYQDFPSRIDHDKWLELLNDPSMWNAHLHRSISHKMVNFLNDHYFLPQAIWKLLESTFRWQEQANENIERFSTFYPKVYAYAIVKGIETTLRYSALVHAGSIDYDAYLRHRESACLSIAKKNLQDTARSLDEAFALFEGDPDLIHIQSQYYWFMGYTDRALTSCREWLRIQPNAPDGYLYRARILYEIKSYHEAITDLNQILASNPNQVTALSLLGNCYVQIGDFKQAKIIFNRMLALDANDIDALLSLADIHARIKQQLNNKPTKYIQQELAQVNKALSIVSFRERLSKGLLLLLGRKRIMLILMIVLHIVLIGSPILHGENSTQYRISHLHEPRVDLKLALTLEELEASARMGSGARVKLKNTQFMGIYELQRTDANGNIVQYYLSSDMAEKNDLMSNVVAYICIGQLGDSSIIVRTDFDESLMMYNKKPIELEGVVYSPAPTYLKDLIDGYWMTTIIGASSYVSGHEIADLYMDSIEQPPGKPILLNWKDACLFILCFFYLLLLLELRRLWRFLRYN